MGLQSTLNFSVTEGSTIKLSQEGLRSILQQIEAELFDGEAYQNTINSLENLVGDGIDTAQNLVKAVGREAIRLAFRQMARQYRLMSAPAPAKSQIPVQVAPPSSDIQPSELTLEKPVLDNNHVEEINDFDEISPLALRPLGATIPPPKKVSKAQQAALLATKQREESLHQIGQTIQKARQACSMSLNQLYSYTLVPVYHITAIEAGQLEKLPEDIYIRGFIRRIGEALKLDGNALAASLPLPANSVVPSWYRPEMQKNHNIPIPLYVGYTALVAGAIGGLSWTINKSQPSAVIEVEDTPPTSISSLPKHTQESEKPSSNAKVSPPEVVKN